MPPVPRTPGKWLVKLLRSTESEQADCRLQARSIAPIPCPWLLSKTVSETTTVHVVGVRPPVQLTATGGAGDAIVEPLRGAFFVNELLLMTRLPEKDWLASMQDATCKGAEKYSSLLMVSQKSNFQPRR